MILRTLPSWDVKWKCLLGIIPPYMLNYIQLNHSRSRYTTRNYMDISLPTIRLEQNARFLYGSVGVQ